jgi:hypothetical protein
MLAELWREDREWSQAMRQLEDEAMLLIQEQIERGQKEGALRQTFDSRFAAVAIMGTVLTSAQYYLIEKENLTPQEKSKQFSTHVVDYISHALGV